MLSQTPPRDVTSGVVDLEVKVKVIVAKAVCVCVDQFVGPRAAQGHAQGQDGQRQGRRLPGQGLENRLDSIVDWG